MLSLSSQRYCKADSIKSRRVHGLSVHQARSDSGIAEVGGRAVRTDGQVDMDSGEALAGRLRPGGASRERFERGETGLKSVDCRSTGG